jgi:hypothetical protein
LAIGALTIAIGLCSIPKVLAIGEYDTSGFAPSVVQNIKWIPDTNLTTTYVNTYVAGSPEKWNGISSKVSVSRGTTTVYNVRILGGTANDPTLVGLTVPFCSAGNGNVCQGGSKTWTAARIFLYESVMQSSGFTTERRKAAVAHEFGHALSLQHVLTSTVLSLMKPTLPTTSTVENLDKANLRGKWGN